MWSTGEEFKVSLFGCSRAWRTDGAELGYREGKTSAEVKGQSHSGSDAPSAFIYTLLKLKISEELIDS